MKRVIVDADACPRGVKHSIIEITGKYGWETVMVASFNHNLTGSFRQIIVGNEPQAVDLVVSNLTAKGDIVVTQDWGLAAMVLGKGAKALSPLGIVYREDNIDFLLEQRHIKSKIRRSGGRIKGPAARTREDDQQFARSLEHLISKQSH